MVDQAKPEESEGVVTPEEPKPEDSKATVKEDGTVEVDVSEVEASQDTSDVEDTRPAAKPTEPKYVTQEELKKVQNAIAYQTRMVEKALKGPAPQQTAAQPAKDGREPNEIDKIAERDWQEGVRMVIRDEYGRLSKQQQEEADKLAKQQHDETVMATNQQYVLGEYSDLNDQYSDTSKRYTEACDELAKIDANFYGNPYGPIAAMRKMEEKMRVEGIPLPGVKEQAADEVARRNRVGATSAAPTKPTVSKGKYVLTAEQKQFCDQNNVPYDQFALNASRLEGGASVEAK